MKEEQFRVLKTLSEATNRMDIHLFAEKVNLTSDQTIHEVQELAKEGFLQKIGTGYGITQKGKSALQAFAPISEEMAFTFYYDIDQPSNFVALTLEQFYEDIKEISANSIEFHTYRGDFENWLREVFKDIQTPTEITDMKAKNLKGDDLRHEILKVLDAKYGIEELL